MEYHIFQESSRWRESQDKRVRSFVRFTAYMMLFFGVLWIAISLMEHLYAITLLVVVMIGIAFYSLHLIRSGSFLVAKNLIFASVTAYFLVVSIFFDGPGVNGVQGIAYFWFLVLAIYFYFVHSDTKPFLRDSISLLLFALFFLFHFRYLSFRPLVQIEQKELINKVTLLTALLATYILTRQFAVQIIKSEEALTASADRLQGLIENILPKSIAEKLTREKKSFADSFSECSVLFADIAGFTRWAESHTPTEVMELLNDIFSKFDDAVERMNLTKIKTIGDAYMVVAGLPESRNDHATALTTLAMEFHTIASEFNHIKFRIGINSGSVAAGVIGKKRFIYDLWGDTVNTASRMESGGEVGRVNISGSTYALVKGKFNCTHRGKIITKNKAEVDMYFVDCIL